MSGERISKNLQALVLEDERRRHKNAGSSEAAAKLSCGDPSFDRPDAPRWLLLSSETDGECGQVCGCKEMTAVYRENRGRHGDRRIAAGLRDRNFPLDHKAVRRLMKKLGLVCGDRGNIVLARKNRAKSRRICRIGAFVPEMGRRRDSVQLVWGEALFISRPRSAQQRSGQLYHFGPSRAEYGRLRAG